MTNQEQMIAEIAREVVARLRSQMQQSQPGSAPAHISAGSSAAAHDGVDRSGEQPVCDETVEAADEDGELQPIRLKLAFEGGARNHMG